MKTLEWKPSIQASSLHGVSLCAAALPSLPLSVPRKKLLSRRWEVGGLEQTSWFWAKIRASWTEIGPEPLAHRPRSGVLYNKS